MTKLARNVFLAIFALSSLLAIGLTLRSMTVQSAPAEATSAPIPEATPNPEHTIAENEKPAVAETNFTLLGTIATSLASLIGFVTTTVITWRKERRESELAAMERKKLELELEKSKLELEELKKKKGKE